VKPPLPPTRRGRRRDESRSPRSARKESRDRPGCGWIWCKPAPRASFAGPPPASCLREKRLHLGQGAYARGALAVGVGLDARWRRWPPRAGGADEEGCGSSGRRPREEASAARLHCAHADLDATATRISSRSLAHAAVRRIRGQLAAVEAVSGSPAFRQQRLRTLWDHTMRIDRGARTPWVGAATMLPRPGRRKPSDSRLVDRLAVRWRGSRQPHAAVAQGEAGASHCSGNMSQKTPFGARRVEREARRAPDVPRRWGVEEVDDGPPRRA